MSRGEAADTRTEMPFPAPSSLEDRDRRGRALDVAGNAGMLNLTAPDGDLGSPVRLPGRKRRLVTGTGSSILWIHLSFAVAA